jgi:hypothetical protein
MVTNEVFGSSVGGALQDDYYMEWYCQKNEKEVGGLEEALFVEGRKVDVD